MLGILKKNVGLRAICWNPNKPNIVAIGTDGGQVVIVDIRRGGLKLLSKSIPSSRPVHRLVFNPDSER